jgi:molecular chaperone HtpG
MLESESEDGQTRLARQAFDLALLSQGMLNGPELTEFVQRSVGMI